MLLLLTWLRGLVLVGMATGFLVTVVTISINGELGKIEGVIAVFIVCAGLPTWITLDNFVRSITIQKKLAARK